MPEEVRMPSLGQTTAELRIVAWLKAEGEPVRMGEPLLSVETDKSTLEIEAFTSGTLLKIVRGADEIVEAGSVLAYIGSPGEGRFTTETRRHGENNTEKTFGRETDLSTSSAPCSVSVSPCLRGELSHSSPTPDIRARPKVLASPVARQLARERGIDLAHVRGSGPEGRIEKEDVLAFDGREER